VLGDAPGESLSTTRRSRAAASAATSCSSSPGRRAIGFTALTRVPFGSSASTTLQGSRRLTDGSISSARCASSGLQTAMMRRPGLATPSLAVSVPEMSMGHVRRSGVLTTACSALDPTPSATPGGLFACRGQRRVTSPVGPCRGPLALMERRSSAHSSVLLAAAASPRGGCSQLDPGRCPPHRCAGGSPGASAP
jgi:hypothetical protein